VLLWFQSDKRNRFISAVAIWIVLGVLVAVAATVSPTFLSTRNITVLLKQAAPLGILAVGQTIVILTGGIDLSVASVMAAVSIFAAGFIDGQDELVWPVVLLVLIGGRLGKWLACDEAKNPTLHCHAGNDPDCAGPPLRL
jgi:ribose/xylose/arabinose/galactoside ABC-type transport system permease subunit